MNLKTGFYILCCMLSLSLLTSCLGDNSSTDEYIASTDAEILSFSLSNDSIPSLDSITFSIDQINGLIYNYDSLAFGTQINEKLLVKYTSAASFTNVMNVTNIANNDTAWIASGKDSVDVSKPVRLKVYAADGITTKYYWMSVNIHQIDPDSMQYTRVATGQSFLNAEDFKTVLFQGVYYAYSKKGAGVSLNRSTNAVNWTATTISGLSSKAVLRDIQQSANGLYAYTSDGELYFSSNAVAWQKITTNYPIKTILGYLNSSSTQSGGLAVILEKENKQVYAISPNLTTWEFGYDVPTDFPIADFSSINTVSMLKQRVTIVGGTSESGAVQNASWSTQNGLYWAKLTDATQGAFPVLKGVNAFLYGSEMYVLNGQFADGTYNKQVYVSIDGGVTWQVQADKCSFPADYTGRYGASLVLDNDGVNFYIFGGQSNVVLTDVWKGLLNKKAFK